MKRMAAAFMMVCLTICAMKIAIAEPIKQVMPNGRNYVLSEGWIYYCVERTDGMCIYRMKSDGTFPEMVYEGDLLLTVWSTASQFRRHLERIQIRANSRVRTFLASTRKLMVYE